MKNLRSLFIILSVVLFLTACEKKETIENHDSISGVLSAGKDMTAEDLIDLEIYLGKFHDSVDFANITLKTTDIDFVAATTLNADGSFSFNKLAPGNYGLAMKNGFIFSIDTALSINLNGNSENFIQKEIERLPEDNGFIVLPPSGNSTTTPYTSIIDLDIKIMDLSPTYRVKKIHCYFDSVYHAYTFDVPEIENTIFRHRIYDHSIQDNNGTTPEYPHAMEHKIEFEIWKYDNGAVTDTIRSTRMPCYYIHTQGVPYTTWPGNDIDISWIPYSQTVTGYWFWEKITTIYLHYEISIHK